MRRQAGFATSCSKAEQKRIFRRFYQVDRRLTSHAGGVGLGLSLVQAVAKLHGSSLVLSDQNPGLRAAVTLPLEAANTAAITTPPQPATAASASSGSAIAPVVTCARVPTSTSS